MAYPVLAALASQIAGNVSSQVIQGEENRKTMGLQSFLNNKSIQDAPAAHVSGLRNAGLSPALANSGGFSAPQTSALGSGLPSMPNFFEMAQLFQNQKLVDAQSRVYDEQASLLGAQEQHQQIMNTRLRDEDSTFDANFRSWLQSEIDKDSPNSSIYKALLDSNEVYSSGVRDSLIRYSQMQRSISDDDLQKLANTFFSQVYNHQINNDIAKYVAQVPKYQQKAFIADLLKVNSEIAKLTVDKDLSKAKIEETSERIKQMVFDLDTEYHSNLGAMMRDGNSLGILMNIGARMLQNVTNNVSDPLGNNSAGGEVMKFMKFMK